MLTRVLQPSIDPFSRPREVRSFWLGFVLALAGLLLALFGSGRITNVETVTGDLAKETQANMAFAHGGVKFVVAEASPETQPEFAVPPPPNTDGVPPVSLLPPMSGRSRLCIDLTARDPCPT